MGAEEGGGGDTVATIRLHVGGLGESVTSDDLQKIFSPLGSVNGIEFVRTKDRSFAYIDFSPSSEKSLTKLFSTYNGCVWKGGRLRFEKAKEHYLARLKREWEENAALASCVSDADVEGDQDSKIPLPEIPKNPKIKDIRQLKIFFPRLGKLKSVPFSGSGKHKYSFQRVDVPALPTHFCECEEHFKPLSSQVKHVPGSEAEYDGINEEEVNIMNSVMNKLFQRENLSESALSDDGLENEEDEHEAEPDEDNIIINVVSSGRNRSSFPRNLEQETTRKRKAIPNERQDSGDRGIVARGEGEKKNSVQSSKKRKSITDVGNGRKELALAEVESSGISQIESDKSMKKPVVATLQNEPVPKHGTGTASSQKASWKALVANGKNTAFSVSSVLSSITSEGDHLRVPHDSDGLGTVDGSTEDMMKQKSRKPRHTNRARKSTLSDSRELNVSTASEVVAMDELDSRQIDTIEEVEHAVPKVGTEELAINRLPEESMPKAPVGDSGSQGKDTTLSLEERPEFLVDDSGSQAMDTVCGLKEWPKTLFGDSGSKAMDTASGLEERSGSDHSNSPKDKEDGNQKISVEKDVDRKSTNGPTGDELQLVKQDVASARSGRGSTWLRNSSWTQMVSQNSTFSITQLVPGIITSEKHVPIEPNGPDAEKSVETIEKSKPVEQKSSQEGCPGMVGTTEPSIILNKPDISEETVVGKDELFEPLINKERDATAKKIARGISGVGEEEETCLFMRNAASVKEWAKAKKALSEPRKRVKNED